MEQMYRKRVAQLTRTYVPEENSSTRLDKCTRRGYLQVEDNSGMYSNRDIREICIHKYTEITTEYNNSQNSVLIFVLEVKKI